MCLQWKLDYPTLYFG